MQFFRQMNLPNALTIVRIFLVPLLVVVLLTQFAGHEVFGVSKALIAAAISAFETPKTSWPANCVSNTTTSSGTRNIRTIVSAFGRFICRKNCIVPYRSTLSARACMIVDCHEGDPSGRGQGHPTQTAHDPHAKADRPDFQS